MLSVQLAAALTMLEQNIDALVMELAQLVAVDTSFPPGSAYAEFADLLAVLTADLGGQSERILVPESFWQADGVSGPRVNLLCVPALGTDELPWLTIYFHTDTAPVGSGWTRAALQLTREDDKVYGRGTADMKGAIAAVLAALRVLAANDVALAFRPKLLFCTDEEGGLYPGIRYLAEQGRLHDSGALLNLNGSALPRIWAGCFGSLDLRLQFVGRAAHSGAPGDGINAVRAEFACADSAASVAANDQQSLFAITATAG